MTDEVVTLYETGGWPLLLVGILIIYSAGATLAFYGLFKRYLTLMGRYAMMAERIAATLREMRKTLDRLL